MASELENLLSMGSMAATGGQAQAALGAAQAIYGITQLPKARAEMDRARASAPSLETPSQFYENYKNAYDSSLAAMQNDAIQANLATSVQALQGAGGRALVGGLTQATAQAQAAQNQMLAQERQMRLAAGQQLAAAQERTIGRKEARSQQEMAYANQAYQAALGNIGGGLGAVGEGLMYGMSAVNAGGKVPMPEAETQVSPKQIELQQKEREKFVSESRQMIANEEKPSFLKTPELKMPSLTETFLPNAFKKESSAPSFEVMPTEYRNEQAMKQYNALQKGYNMVTEYNKYFFNGGMMTGGAFSHATNPINLVQNGQKIGEATGGEYILNPSQAAAVAKQSSYARKLFKMFEKNAKKNK